MVNNLVQNTVIYEPDKHYNGLAEIENATLRVLSLGAGVQSSVLALMAAKGLVTKPDVAIFADTQWEPQSVYDHLQLSLIHISEPTRPY
mgnify:CR=1 FL=1